MTNRINWNEENTAALVAQVEGVELVTQDMLEAVAEAMGTSKRSVGSKLRKLGFEVQKASEVSSTRWPADAEEELAAFVQANSGAFTYAEIAAQFRNSEYTAKQIQGKLLSLELFAHVKATEKTTAPRTYSEVEEATFIEMANNGAFMEAIAEELGRPIQSVRGKALSLQKNGDIASIPKQEKSTAAKPADVLEGLNVAEMTVAEIAEKTEKSERGIKSMLSRRGITCADYDGAARREKLDAASDS